MKEEKIFNYFNPDANDEFSKLSGNELQNLLVLLDDSYISYREEIDIPKNITFGLELEFENAKVKTITKQLKDLNLLNEWIIKPDSSLVSGAEINSPILVDRKIYWEELRKVCKMVQKKAVINFHSAGHIHVGAHILENKESYWLNFIKLWATYENIVFRFSYGNFLRERANVWKYAAPMSNSFWNSYHSLLCSNFSLLTIKKSVDHQRRQAVNFENVQINNDFAVNNTIEFRCPNGTLDPVIWQNNVNLLTKMLLYSKNPNYNDKLIINRHKINKDNYSNLECYSEIYLNQALELCDMIFSNNIDKIYFLRQYIKSLDVGTKKLQKAKKITKV